MATKALQKHQDVFLIDHAWSFQFKDAIDVLAAKPGLVERLEKLTEFSDKLDIPSVPSKEKDADQAFAKQMEAGGRVFDLEGFGIKSLASFKWP